MVKVSAASVCGEDLLPGLQTADFLACAVDEIHLSAPYYKSTNPTVGSLILMICSKLNYLPKAPPPNTITVGARASRYDFGEQKQ